jgi:hypothetical protein
MEFKEIQCEDKDNIKVDFKVMGCGLDSSGSGYGPVVISCEHDIKPLGSIKCRKLN